MLKYWQCINCAIYQLGSLPQPDYHEYENIVFEDERILSALFFCLGMHSIYRLFVTEFLE